ncbi:MFS transporter [Aeromicrobium sp. YIM 150415]|uniref:MFS transporter n=1 Tax=Aeromicrobium sp. YIM 150415 TaxID=2803912 RepID=UPI00196589FD|nr:MFS transporter [Aeromicrobium sp. YIM 150415]MBM9464531.1 MFS transporter [Aeromicrobium sp. YIM 150415]
MNPPSSRTPATTTPWGLVTGLGLAVLCYSTTQMMVVPMLPDMAADIGVDADAAAWLVSAFLLCTAVSTPLLGQVGDVVGRSRVLIAVLALSAIGSLLAMTAQNFTLLLLARILQGLGGSTFPLAFGMARDVLPRARVAMAVGLISGSFGLGGSLGLVIAGFLSDAGSWRWTFTVSLAMSVGAIGFLWPTRRLHEPLSRRRLDWRGALTVTIGFTCLLLAISQGQAVGWLRASLPLSLAGAGLLVVWWWQARRQSDPVFDVRMLVERSILPAHLTAILLGFMMYSNGFLIPLFVQHPAGLGRDVSTSSLVLLPALALSVVAGYLAAVMGRRSPALPIVTGAILMALGFALAIAAGHHLLLLIVAVALSHGIGLNLMLAAIASTVTLNAPPDRIGEATGVNTAARTVGGSIGSQVAAALITAPAWGAAAGFSLAFGVCGIVAVIAAGLALLARQPAPSPSDATA